MVDFILSSGAVHLIFQDKVSPRELRLSNSARLASEQAPGSLLLPPPPLASASFGAFCTEMLGTAVRSSCLWGKDFTHWDASHSLFMIFLIHQMITFLNNDEDKYRNLG